MYSIISPIYLEEKILDSFTAVFNKMDSEYDSIFVKSTSINHLRSILERLCDKKFLFRLIDIRRKFEHQSAATTIIDLAQRDYGARVNHFRKCLSKAII